MTPTSTRQKAKDPDVAVKGEGGVIGTGDLGTDVPESATADGNVYEPNPDAPEGSVAQVQIVDA